MKKKQKHDFKAAELTGEARCWKHLGDFIQKCRAAQTWQKKRVSEAMGYTRIQVIYIYIWVCLKIVYP